MRFSLKRLASGIMMVLLTTLAMPSMACDAVTFEPMPINHAIKVTDTIQTVAVAEEKADTVDTLKAMIGSITEPMKTSHVVAIRKTLLALRLPSNLLAIHNDARAGPMRYA